MYRTDIPEAADGKEGVPANEPVRLLGGAGTHSVSFNDDFSLLFDVWSSLRSPHEIRLHETKGGEVVRDIDLESAERVRRALAPYAAGLPEPELLSVPTHDGFVMEALLIQPPTPAAPTATAAATTSTTTASFPSDDGKSVTVTTTTTTTTSAPDSGTPGEGHPVLVSLY